jgi:hypothetical protein
MQALQSLGHLPGLTAIAHRFAFRAGVIPEAASAGMLDGVTPVFA